MRATSPKVRWTARALLALAAAWIRARSYRDRVFQAERIVLDYSEFRDCLFLNCRIVVIGGGNLTMTGCTLLNCTLEFDHFAGVAVHVLRSLDGLPLRNIEAAASE